MEKPYVVVTTDRDKKGVFCGFLQEETKDYVILEEARMIIYWSPETRGVVGIASIGCQKGSRVTPPAPEIKLFGVTSIIKCSKKAKEKMRRDIWS